MEGLTLAEAILTTASGEIKALVEFLKTEDDQSHAFHFLALDDANFHRLVSSLKLMPSNGWAEDPQTNRPVAG